MKVLGIDYGKKKIGLALSAGKLAEPFGVLRYEDIKILREQLKQIIKENDVDRLVVGISEAEMAEESKKFSQDLHLEVPVETFDETLTTQEAQKLAIAAGIKRQKRRRLEDAYAASIMLQSYLDTYV